MNVNRQIISSRFKNDGKPIIKINELQKETIVQFISDERIAFFEVHKCPLCEGNEVLVVAEKDAFGIPLETALCKKCGLLFSVKQLEDNSSKIFYTEYYRKIYDGVSAPVLDNPYYSKMMAGETSVHKVPKFLNKESVVLEIGCAAGWNLINYKQANISHIGFDYDESMIKYGREKYGLEIHSGGVEEARKMGVKADFVVLSQVLEHVSDPVSFLKNLATLMNEGALIRITVPCLDYLKFFGGSGTSFDMGSNLQNAHNFMFSERTLRLTLMKAGFSPVIMLSGFCLAKKCNNSEALDSHASLDKGLEALNILIRSEKSLPLKKFIFNKLPARLQFLLSYSHLIFRPIDLFLYLIILHTGFGSRYLDRK